MRGDDEAALEDGDTGRRRDVLPDVAGPSGLLPAVTGLLPGHRDEAEIAHRGSVGLRVAVEDDNPLAAPGRRHGMGEADDPCADDRDVKDVPGHDPISL